MAQSKLWNRQEYVHKIILLVDSLETWGPPMEGVYSQDQAIGYRAFHQAKNVHSSRDKSCTEWQNVNWETPQLFVLLRRDSWLG